jgi:hypothetical protein
VRRIIAVIVGACAVVFGIFLVTRGPAGPSLHITPKPRQTACRSLDCIAYAATLKWTRIPSAQSGTGYNVLLNGTRVGTTTGTSYTFSGLYCGRTFQLGVQAHDHGSEVRRMYSRSYTTPTCGANTPSNSGVPAVMDTTLLNNYEQPDVVQSSSGSWENCSGSSSCTYTYQFQDCTGISGTRGTGCTNIGSTPQCSATTATTCNYTLTTGDVGDYIVSLVAATNGNGSSSPVVSPAEGPVVASRVNHFCSVAAAYSNLTTGPHLCGWPDSTNVGYQNAPGYPGSLTTASAGSQTCPTTPKSNHTYRFCRFPGLILPSGLINVTFYGSEFHSNAVNNGNVSGGRGDNNITFDYDTFQPNVAAPPVTCAESYQYGIYNEGGEIGQLTVTHSNFWGFGNAIDTEGSTQANPQYFAYNWIHDSVTTGGCGYHNDGIGLLGGGSESYATVDHNTIEFVGNTNTIAWQNGTYDHIWNTNNLLSGDPYAGARCTSGCSAPTNIVTTGNTFSTYVPMAAGSSPIDGATHYWANPGGIWRYNFWAVPPAAPWGTQAYNGYYWVPTGNSSSPQDCGFVSATDFPNYTNPCR